MSVDVQDQAEVQANLWKEIGDARSGMLGVIDGPPRHFQPMTPNCDREAGRIWFFIKREADLFKALGEGREALFTIQVKDYQASIAGRLSAKQDRAVIERYWNPVIASWFSGGKDDPTLGLIRLDCEEAEIWLNQASPVRFGFEVAKSHVTHAPPDVGDKASVSFG